MNDDICKLHLKTLSAPNQLQTLSLTSAMHDSDCYYSLFFSLQTEFTKAFNFNNISFFKSHIRSCCKCTKHQIYSPQQKPPLLNKKWSSKFEILTTNKLQLWSKKGMIEKNRPTFKRCGGEIQLKSQSGMWRSVFLSKSLLWLLVLVQSLNEQADAARQHLHIENKNCTCNRLHSS